MPPPPNKPVLPNQHHFSCISAHPSQHTWLNMIHKSLITSCYVSSTVKHPLGTPIICQLHQTRIGYPQNPTFHITVLNYPASNNQTLCNICPTNIVKLYGA
ncbi:hypothetical protein BDA96_03G060100 [Sorghum bicolor]|uniref:Uncharacterized protein n=2 Tax=Sorghum bicolor TaxID=4558 RepID=A0A921UNX5_SORBI|nr:hypothetical protein BDA96_03G060100 [Sorghum bicolor]KXG31789.1 hypothetical protein SORBI_3003G056200 [Sorghum bicolor]